jgi:hypothetical protein
MLSRRTAFLLSMLLFNLRIAAQTTDDLTDLTTLSTGQVYGLEGCDDSEESLCISVKATNRSKTIGDWRGAGFIPWNAAARPPIEPGTELSISMNNGTVDDLVLHLGSLLLLEHGVVAKRGVARLTISNLLWKGLLGDRPAGPIPTQEGPDIWIVVKDHGSKLQLVAKKRAGQ